MVLQRPMMAAVDLQAQLEVATTIAVITRPDGSPSTGPDGAFLASPAGVHQAIRDALTDGGPRGS